MKSLLAFMLIVVGVNSYANSFDSEVKVCKKGFTYVVSVDLLTKEIHAKCEKEKKTKLDYKK